MTPDIAGDAAVALVFISGLMLVFTVGGFVADYVFPHIPAIRRFIDSLPSMED